MATSLGCLSVKVRLFLLIRYPVAIGIVLTGLFALAWWIDRELLGNLLVLETPYQLFNITWLSLLVAAFVLIAYRVIHLNAANRFSDFAEALNAVNPGATLVPPAPLPKWVRWLLLFLMGLPLPVSCVVFVTLDPSPSWVSAAAWCARNVPLLGVAVIVAGALFAVLLLMVLTALQELLLSPNVISPDLLPIENWWPINKLKKVRVDCLYFIGDLLARVLDRFGPGYTRKITHPITNKEYLALAPGHAQALLWLGATLFFYLGSYFLVYSLELVPRERSPFAALFFVLLVLLLIGCVLSGLSFLLDYTRIPVLLAVVVLSLVVYLIPKTDHYYELNPPLESEKPSPPVVIPVLTDVFENRDFPKVVPSSGTPKKTLVIVTAAGGGIQASAWTTRVLSGLDECYGPEFTRSVGIISAVSGGSVGTMYYLANGRWMDKGPPFDEPARQRMMEMSKKSSLEAAAWGVAHPDLMRLFTPFILDRYVDRGWAIEEVWRKELSELNGDWKNGDFRLRDWIKPIQDKNMPIPIFNATLSETGQRLLLSPVLGRKSADNAAQGPNAGAKDPGYATEAQEFFNMYGPEANPRVTTAVRLSAAFTYVSPISRPGPPAAAKQAYHVADGGYSDNEGITTVVRWLRFLLLSSPPHGRKFDHILIVRILPFPADQIKDAESHRGWLYELLGPLTTLENVRPASQTERNSLALDLLRDATLPQAAENIREKRREGEQILAQAELSQLRVRSHKSEMSTLSKSKSAEKSALQTKIDVAQQESNRFAREGEAMLQTTIGETVITWAEFVYHPPVDEPIIPLSWKLTTKQKKHIEESWTSIRDGGETTILNKDNMPPMQVLDRFFKRCKPVPQDP